MKNTSQPAPQHGSVGSYLVGFVLSIALTILPFIAVTQHALHGWSLIIFLAVSACAQLFVQLRFFLHLGKGTDRQWNAVAFAFMVIVVIIVVAGSLWIMKNLNYNMMSPQDTDSHMIHESNKGF